jgi:hypothetical protein
MPDSPRYKAPFDAKAFVSNAGVGITVERFQKNQEVFVQGENADTVCYLQKKDTRRPPSYRTAARRPSSGFFKKANFSAKAAWMTGRSCAPQPLSRWNNA